MVLPRKWSGSLKPVVLHLAGTGDHVCSNLQIRHISGSQRLIEDGPQETRSVSADKSMLFSGVWQAQNAVGAAAGERVRNWLDSAGESVLYPFGWLICELRRD